MWTLHPTVAAALQAPPDEEPEQPELDIEKPSAAPAEPAADPVPAPEASKADDIDPAVRARMDACLDDTVAI